MHNAACFGGGERACTLLNHFKRETERHRALAPDLGLKRFALDQFHNVKTFTVLFAVVTDTRDVRMTNLRGRPRFAQETRSRPGVLCDCSVDYFKRDDGIQNRVARAISYRHCSGAELDRKAVHANFHFKVIVLQRPRHQSSAVFDFVRLSAIAQKTKANETTKAFTLRERSSAGWAGFGKCNYLFNSGRGSKSMPRSITPVPFEWFPEGACTRPLSFRADGIPTVLLTDFKLLRKSESGLSRSRGSLDPRMTADSRLTISGSALMLSESDRDNEALDPHRPDQKLCSPLPSLALRDNADADATARYAASPRELQVSPPLLLDLAASVRCRQQTALALQAIRLFLPPQMHLANVARRVSRYSTPRLDHNRANR